MLKAVHTHDFAWPIGLRIPTYAYHICLSLILSSTLTAVILELAAPFTWAKIVTLFPSYGVQEGPSTSALSFLDYALLLVLFSWVIKTYEQCRAAGGIGLGDNALAKCRSENELLQPLASIPAGWPGVWELLGSAVGSSGHAVPLPLSSISPGPPLCTCRAWLSMSEMLLLGRMLEEVSWNSFFEYIATGLQEIQEIHNVFKSCGSKCCYHYLVLVVDKVKNNPWKHWSFPEGSH